MQVSVENNGELRRTLTIKFPVERLHTQLNERVMKMCRSAKLNGFRQGKVPKAVIQQRFGEQLRAEVLADLIESTLNEAVGQEKLRPVAKPSIDTTGKPDNDEITYTAKFEVMPEFPELDIASLDIERFSVEITDTDVDTMIETLRREHQHFEKSTEPSVESDVVTYAYSADSGGDRLPDEGMKQQTTRLDRTGPFAALHELLLGQVAGAGGEADITFPEGFDNECLAGKTAHVCFQLIEVRKPILPEVNAQWIKRFGVTDGDLDSFRREIRANMERELKMTLLDRLKAEVSEKLSTAYNALDVPQVMVQEEIQRLTTNRKKMGKEDVSPELISTVARKRVLAGLLLGEVANRQNIEVDRHRVTEQLSLLASSYQKPEEFVELYRNDRRLMLKLEEHVLEDQVAEWVAEHANTAVKKLGFDEVMRPSGS